MPKVVDATQRRREITEATCRVIERSGLPQATLGNVARESGLAVGSVRHYVGNHQDLLRLTMTTLAADVGARIADRGEEMLLAELPAGSSRFRDRLVALLGELLPLDEQRLREAVVWISFGEAARTDPTLQPLFTDLFDRVRVVLTRVLEGVRPGVRHRTNEVDAHRLAALMNGLSLDAVQVPDRVDPTVITLVLRRELDAILG